MIICGNAQVVSKLNKVAGHVRRLPVGIIVDGAESGIAIFLFSTCGLYVSHKSGHIISWVILFPPIASIYSNELSNLRF